MNGDEPFWETPEEAAVGSFSQPADAKVVGLQWIKPEHEATVHITVGPDYDYFVHVGRATDGWVELDSHN